MSDSKYEYKKPEKQLETLVDVVLPSGNVIQMAKPSKYDIIFRMQSLPSDLTEKAMEAWGDKGEGSEGASPLIEGTTAEEKLTLFKSGLSVAEDVVRLSRKPKLVTKGVIPGKGEMRVTDFSDEDLDFLMKWVASGGTASRGLASFRQRPNQSPVDRLISEDDGPETIKPPRPKRRRRSRV